jgi:hypothetical protein
LDPRFVDTNPAEDNGFLRAIKSVKGFLSEGHVKDTEALHFIITTINWLMPFKELIAV